MKRRAILFFADSLGLDLVRRRFPQFLRPLFRRPGRVDFETQADLHIFSSAEGGHHAGGIFHRQRGRTFGEKLENAVEQVAGLGYDEIVVVGRDCPRLSAADVTIAFEGLTSRRLVLGPDHRGGCYLIALRSNDRALLGGIRWQKNTDCAQLRGQCGEDDVLMLAVKHDLDSWADVEALARHARDKVACSIRFFLKVICMAQADATTLFVDRARQFVRVRGQRPPPAWAN